MNIRSNYYCRITRGLALNLFALLLALAFGRPASAATVAWTNLAGGNWSVADNWSPNQVPGPSDNALITLSGSYTVSLDGDATVGNLTLGGSTGTQNLQNPGYTFTVNGASQVQSNGVMSLNGGVLAGSGLLTINGRFNWSGGRIGAGTALTLGSSGLFVSAGAGLLDFSGVLTNAGTIRLTSGVLRCIAYSAYSGGYGLLVNAPGGLIDFQADVGIDAYNDATGVGAPALINQGTIRKSAGSNSSSISLPFYNSGMLDVQSGTVAITGGGNGNGIFKAEAGATLAYPTDYEVDGVISGSGTNLLSGGVFTLKGSIAGLCVWSAGIIGTNTTGTVATNGVLVTAGGGYMDFSGILTNAGTIRLTTGIFRCIAYSAYGGGYGLLVNAPGGLIDFQADVNLDAYNDATGFGAPTVINQGTVRKSGGSALSALNPPLLSSGTVDVQTGTLRLAGHGGYGNGVFQAAAGATLDFYDDYRVESALTGQGTVSFTGGNFALNGSLKTATAVLQGSAVLGGTNGVIADALTWASGRIGTGSTLTVATNGVVTGNGGGYLELSGILTNTGTIILTNGALRCIAYSAYGGGYGLLVNAPGGLIDFQNDVTMDVYNDATGLGAPAVINRGTVRKSNGSGTAIINPPFFNVGTLDARSGTLSLYGPYDLTGGTLNFGLRSATNFGKISFPAAAALTGTVSATLLNGYQPLTGDSFAVLTYVSESGIFTNAVLPFADAWQTNYTATLFSLQVVNVRPTLLANASQTVKELTTLQVTNVATDPDAAQTLSFSLVSPPNGMHIDPSNGVITWTPDQTQSPGTNTITVVVTDNGTPSLSATNSFQVVVQEVNVPPSLPANLGTRTADELSLLTVTNTATNFNIHSSILGYGLVNPPQGATINASGIITWTPSKAQSPNTNILTTIVTNSNPYDQVNPRLTATNSFTVIIYAPTLAPISNRTANAGQTVTLTASATDNDSSRTLTYDLVTAPAGASITANTGQFTWRPPAASANSSNYVQVRVTANHTPPLTDVQGFAILVNPITSVRLTPVAYSNSQFRIQVTGPTGPDYVFMVSSNLQQWADLATNATPAPPFTFADPAAGTVPRRVYRVRLAP
jgi:hypothetical protein